MLSMRKAKSSDFPHAEANVAVAAGTQGKVNWQENRMKLLTIEIVGYTKRRSHIDQI